MPTVVAYSAFPMNPLRDFVSRLMRPTTQVQWAGDGRRFPGPVNGKPGAQLELDVTRIQRLGTTEERKIWDDTANANIVQVIQQCVYTISFHLDSWSFDQPAYEDLQRLHLKLRRPGSKAALQAIGLAFGVAHPVVSLNVIADNHSIFSAVTEIEFNFAAWETDETATGDIIEMVNSTDPQNPVGIIPDDPPLSP